MAQILSFLNLQHPVSCLDVIKFLSKCETKWMKVFCLWKPSTSLFFKDKTEAFTTRSCNSAPFLSHTRFIFWGGGIHFKRHIWKHLMGEKLNQNCYWKSWLFVLFCFAREALALQLGSSFYGHWSQNAAAQLCSILLDAFHHTAALSGGGEMPVASWLVWQNRIILIHSNLSGY